MGTWPYIATAVVCLVVIVLLARSAISRLGDFLVLRSDRAFCGKVEGRGRLLGWDDVAQRIRGGDGVLIAEGHIPKGPMRYWWTAREDILGFEWPVQEIGDELSSSRRGARREAEERAARDLCAQVTDTETGKGRLVRLDTDQLLCTEWAASVLLPQSAPIISLLFVCGRPVSVARGDFFAALLAEAESA
jgi:hypothetical protein